MLQYIGDGKMEKAKCFLRVDNDVFSTFRTQLLLNVGGEEEKGERTDNCKSWYNIKTFAPFQRHKVLHACM